MYHELLLEHYKFPTHRGELENATVTTSDLNASCGDQLTLFLCIENNRITKARFVGSGCIISQASADLLAAHIETIDLETIRTINKDQLLELLGISLGPNRLKCALLSLQIIQKGLAEYKAE